MPCLFAMVCRHIPQTGDVHPLAGRPAMFSTAFGGSWLWPLLGIIFLPFTTLMYIVLLLVAGIGLTGWDWVLAGRGRGAST